VLIVKTTGQNWQKGIFDEKDDDTGTSGFGNSSRTRIRADPDN